MEARIALASVVVFGGVLAAGMLVSQVDGGEPPSVGSSDFSQAASIDPLTEAATGSEALAASQGSEGSSPIHWDDDDWDEDDRDEDDDEWDDRYERDHDDDHDDDDRYEDDDDD